MKITKSRLLQIIKEEVELREKNLEENTFELDEETVSLMKQLGKQADDKKQDPNAVDDGEAFDFSADKDGSGKLSPAEIRDVLRVAVSHEPKAHSVNQNIEKEEVLFSREKDKQGKHPIIPSKNSSKNKPK